MTERLTAIKKGIKYEDIAVQFLITQGLVLLERNYYSRWGELDILMQDKKSLVVVEVRYRKNNYYGSAAESVTVTKQKRIKLTTEQYIVSNKINSAVRFDVIAITGTNAPEWIKNAFY